MDNAEATDMTPEKKKKKKDKVRSAWISFAGRIVAQMVGAIATVALGVMVLHRYTSTDGPPALEYGRNAYALPAASGQSGPAPIVIFVTPAMLGLRDAGERAGSANRSCDPARDTPAASAAHFDDGTFLSR